MLTNDHKRNHVITLLWLLSIRTWVCTFLVTIDRETLRVVPEKISQILIAFPLNVINSAIEIVCCPGFSCHFRISSCRCRCFHYFQVLLLLGGTKGAKKGLNLVNARSYFWERMSIVFNSKRCRV